MKVLAVQCLSSITPFSAGRNEEERRVSDPMQNIVMLHVWVHGDADTGKPSSVDVFEVIGRMHFAWFTEAMEDNNGPDLAEDFYRHTGKVDVSAWFIVRMSTEIQSNYETGADITEHYAEVIGVVAT